MVQPVFAQSDAPKGEQRYEQAARKARAKREAKRRRALASAADFVEFALRHEVDGSEIRNAPFHCEWQDHLNANKMAVLIAPVEHAKTQQVSVGKVVHMLGKNPNLRIAIVSNTATQAEKILRSIRKHIDSNPRVREVFPDLKPSPNQEDPWHTSAITVDRSTISKDPSVQACGLYGPINGARIDVIILDDILDFECTRTEEQRKKAQEWFDSTVFPRLYRGGSLFAVGTPWHPEDLLHELEKRPGFAVKRYSAVENPDDPPERWRPIWPEQWDVARLLSKRDNMPETIFSRKYLCRVRLDATSRFKEIWLDRMCKLGRSRTFLAEAPQMPGGMRRLPCFTGVDLGVGQGANSALTVLFTVALMPTGRRLVVDIESGQWTAPEIVDRIASCHRRFDSSILVENNAGQRWIVDMCQGRVPVTGFHTTAGNKFDEEFGVESLAVEMRNGLWVMPSGDTGDAVPAEGDAWMQECLFYDPEAHTGDRLMASWLAREALRKFAASSQQRVDVLSR